MKTGNSLKDSLGGWSGFPKLDRTFQPRRTRKAANSVMKELGAIQPRQPSSYDLEALYYRILRSWYRHRSLNQIASRDQARLPWVLFYSPQGAQPGFQNPSTGFLGAESSFVEEFDQWLSKCRASGPALALLQEFLRVYPTDLPTFDSLRTLLQKTIEKRLQPVPPSVLKWQNRCEEYAFLRLNGHRLFVDKLLRSTSAPAHTLEKAGLGTGLAQCGFLKAAVRSHLLRVRSQLSSRIETGNLECTLSVLEWDGKLRFPSMRREIAGALLGPFLYRNRPRDRGNKNLLQPFFLRHFGHPHLPSGKGRWFGVPHDLRRVFLRWLVDVDLDRFLMLIEETALDRHWRYRRAFWWAFHGRNLIDELWFVLGRRAANHLRTISANDDAAEYTGKLSRGSQSDHSVVLLRMPGMTIAEWSHNGSCRIWLDGNPRAPKLYELSYARRDLTNGADFVQVHHYSDRGLWQSKIARWMRDNTGVEVRFDDYMPH